jgi:hypothetical protein
MVGAILAYDPARGLIARRDGFGRRCVRHVSFLLAAGLAIGLHGFAQAADPRYPDWPCVQAKVPELSVAALWAGPPLDDAVKAWENDPKVKELVPRLAARRVPIEDAQKSIVEFVTGGTAEREQKAKLVFAGLFDRLNRERTEVMNGIERLGRASQDPGRNQPGASQGRGTFQSSGMEHEDFRGSTEIDPLRLRGAGADRAALVRAGARGAAGDRVGFLI